MPGPSPDMTQAPVLVIDVYSHIVISHEKLLHMLGRLYIAVAVFLIVFRNAGYVHIADRLYLAEL